MHVLITGTNRGIGLELTREYLEAEHTVFATARRPAQAAALQKLRETSDRLFVFELDISSPDSIAAFVEQVPEPVDLLINNAGILLNNDPFLHVEEMDRSWTVNTMGAVRLTEALLPALRSGSGKQVINVSTQMASIANAGSGHLSYRVSKAALNMATVVYAHRLREEKISVVAIHPGWVRTEMGGKNAPIDASASARAIRELAAKLSLEDTGCFIDATNGKELPW